MNSEELIASGTLELFVFGLLTEAENEEIQQVAKQYPEVQAEIIAIEKAVVNLSYSISPNLSAENYNRIREKLIERENGVVTMQSRRSVAPYLGWAAAAVLMFGIGVQYYQYNKVSEEAQQANAERAKFEQMVAGLQRDNSQTERALNMLRAKESKDVLLEGQQIAPDAYAKVYVNDTYDEIYVDIAGLPEPPEGKVYQVWALKLNPMTPTSIGVLDTKDANAAKGIYRVENFEGAEAFGITLEPAGGSVAPTLEQLYTLGKV